MRRLGLKPGTTAGPLEVTCSASTAVWNSTWGGRSWQKKKKKIDNLYNYLFAQREISGRLCIIQCNDFKEIDSKICMCNIIM